jgi:hypothetical protein
MKSKVNIEWLVEALDYYEGCGDDPDIFEVVHRDTYAEALATAAQAELPTRIGLVRDRGNDVEGIIDRQWAYINDGKLPARFDWGGGEDGGALVPARYHRELEA